MRVRERNRDRYPDTRKDKGRKGEVEGDKETEGKWGPIPRRNLRDPGRCGRTVRVGSTGPSVVGREGPWSHPALPEVLQERGVETVPSDTDVKYPGITQVSLSVSTWFHTPVCTINFSNGHRSYRPWSHKSSH